MNKSKTQFNDDPEGAAVEIIEQAWEHFSRRKFKIFQKQIVKELDKPKYHKFSEYY